MLGGFMNSIVFSNLTKKQIIDLYNNKEYKKVIQLLTMIFTNRNGYREYLSKNQEVQYKIYIKNLRYLIIFLVLLH